MGASGFSGILRRPGAVRGRVAGARAWPARAAGSGDRAALRERPQARTGRGAQRGWRSLALAIGLLALSDAHAQILSSRIWPARDYTRLTLESKSAIKHSLFSVKDPERLVLDLETDELAPALSELQGKVAPEDPYIKGLRVARNRPGVIRLVLDLKADVKPQLFDLPPLAALLEEASKAQEEKAKPPGSVARLATIVIDAGHGGEDPGALGRHGSREKDITLGIARRLKALVDAEPNMRALLTRDGDYFLPLAVRVDKARKVKADLFVSIHADAFVRPDARGSSVFALSDRRATSEMARILAKQENESDLVGGAVLDGKDDYVKRTILDLWQTGTIDHSLRLGGSVLKRLGTVNTLHKPHVEQASFKVLTAPNIPSILVETAFISNPEEEKRLNDQDYQDRLAQALLDGIRDYF